MFMQRVSPRTICNVLYCINCAALGSYQFCDDDNDECYTVCRPSGPTRFGIMLKALGISMNLVRNLGITGGICTA